MLRILVCHELMLARRPSLTLGYDAELYQLINCLKRGMPRLSEEAKRNGRAQQRSWAKQLGGKAEYQKSN
jgi:hypothetical protein